MHMCVYRKRHGRVPLHCVPPEAISKWSQLLPNINDQALIHQLRLGALKWTLTTKSRQGRAVAHLPQSWKSNILQCQCHREPQTSAHIWKRCPISHAALAKDFSSVPDFPRHLLQVLDLDSNMDMEARRGKLRVLTANLRSLESAIGTSSSDFKKLYAP